MYPEYLLQYCCSSQLSNCVHAHKDSTKALKIRVSCFLHCLCAQVLESRALYNLGNGYHSKGKQASLGGAGQRASQQDVEEQVRGALEQAARHYE